MADVFRRYDPISTLALEISKDFCPGDYVIIGMSHPLHFIANEAKMLEFLLQLEELGLDLSFISFFYLGLLVENGLLIRKPSRFQCSMLKEGLLCKLNGEGIVDSNMGGLFQLWEKELQLILDGPKKGRSNY